MLPRKSEVVKRAIKPIRQIPRCDCVPARSLAPHARDPGTLGVPVRVVWHFVPGASVVVRSGSSGF